MGRLTRVLTLTLTLLSYNACKDVEKIPFTTEEEEWLKTHPTIILSVDNTYPPLNYRNRSGQLVGLNIDLIDLIEDKLGVEIKLEGSSWAIALEKAMNHEVDGVMNATPLDERKTKLNFTQSVIQDPKALICLKEMGKTSGFKDFQDKKIAAKRNSRQLLELEEKVPKENIVEIETLFEGLELLVLNEVDAVYDDLAPLYHIISSSNLNNIKFALIEKGDQGSTIGLRNNDPILLSVMNKAISAITDEEIKSINEKWIQTGIHDYTRYYVAIGILVLIALSIFAWNRILNVIVKRKTNQLSEELSNRKHIEKELVIAKEKAEESDKLKSAFLANMSHEIRTPMNGILGFTGLLTNPETTQEERKRYADIITASSEQLMTIVNDILDISRIEAEEVEIISEEVNINSIFDELFEVFSLRTAKKGVELKVVKPLDNEECYFISDKVKLKQVLENLIANAIKFTKEGFVEFGYSVEEQYVKFYVKDTGIGISADMQSKIFDRFRQAELDYTREYGGTGLGLSISEKLIQLLNGEIWVNSEIGKGSVFYFQLPLEKIESSTIKESSTIASKQQPAQSDSIVLIAEDEDVNYKYIAEVLKSAGISYMRAVNGQEAVKICSTQPKVKVILMDIKMPIMNGYEATQRIKKIWPELPIIAQTAYAMSDDEERALEAGCTDYITKPIKREVLLRKVSKYIN